MNKVTFYRYDDKNIEYTHNCESATRNVSIPLSDIWFEEHQKSGLILQCPYCGVQLKNFMIVDPETTCTICGKKLTGDEYGWCEACDRAQETRYWKSFT